MFKNTNDRVEEANLESLEKKKKAEHLTILEKTGPLRRPIKAKFPAKTCSKGWQISSERATQ